MDEIRLERTYATTPKRIWELWTTRGGIEQWWAPDGFDANVQELELRPGGELRHSLTATAPEQVQFMESAGLPLTTYATKRFTEVDEPRRLEYVSHIDFVPGVEPYEHLTQVDLQADEDSVRVVMTMEPLHDDVWTQRLVAGRENELDNLGRLVDGG
jgi:uncharacterized protein YndB with AHSA1/START domain